MEFSRQEYWRELPCPPAGDLPNSGIEPGSPVLQADSLSSELLGKPHVALPTSTEMSTVAADLGTKGGAPRTFGRKRHFISWVIKSIFVQAVDRRANS